MKAVLVTGMGIVSAIGNNRQEVLRSLRDGHSGITQMRYLHTKHRQYPVGEVPLSNQQLRTLCGDSVAADENISRAALLGLVAAKEAVMQAGLTPDDMPLTALVSGTCVGGMDLTENCWEQLLNTDDCNQLIRQHPCGEHTRFISDALGGFGYITTISTACSSALNALIHGARLIQQGLVDIVVAGSAECLTNYHFNGFRTLHILSEQPCRPFDDNRNGINLGEGAAYLVLESATSAARRGKQPIAWLTGMGNACDAFHQTASSEDGEGACRAMREALKSAGLKPNQIDYLNAHGTATPNNDLSETHAIQRVFTDKLPVISSTKGFTGHTTAASGAIESVICLLAMQNGFVPVNLNWEKPMENGIIPYVESNKPIQLKHIMCNAFGFGGNDSSVIFSAQPATPATVAISERHLYVHRAAQISSALPLSDDWMTSPLLQTDRKLPVQEPDYSQFIPAGQARRLGPLLKRSLATALQCLQNDDETIVPDAIIAGTGLGCIASTETFLNQIKNNGEELLNPTPFIQSTHNTISSSLAIWLKAHAYNNTFSHLDTSFDSALVDVVAHLAEPDCTWRNILLGAYDELTPAVYNLLRKAEFGGKTEVPLGETAVSMLLSTQPSDCEITDVLLPDTADCNIKYLENLLQTEDVLLIGANGDADYDRQYDSLLAYYCDRTILHYKHLFGESLSSSAMGIYVAARCLLHNTLPAVLHYKGNKQTKANGIVFVNYSYTGSLTVVRLQRTPQKGNNRK